MGLLLEPGLVDLLIRDVEGQPGALPLLSHALRRTWERREGRTLTVAGYRATGGIEGCVAQSAEHLYTSLEPQRRPMLRQVLLRLVSTDDDGEPVRNRVPRRVLLSDPERERIVEALVTARLVSTDRDTVQIAHECLTTAWPRLMTWLDEDVEGQRILRHLTASADAWDAMGRPDSEMYRGARLRKALEWQQACRATAEIADFVDPHLTGVERDFLAAGAQVRDAEARAAEQRARQEIRARRSTGLMLIGGVALFVVALVAGLIAIGQQHQRDAADLAAAVGEAKRVDGAARAAPAFDTSTLLALEANKIYDSTETRGVISELLQTHPALIRSLPTRDPVQSLAVSPDGRTLLVGEDDETTQYSADTMSPVSQYGRGAWTTSYRADGRQLLLVGRGHNSLGEDGRVVSAAVTDPGISDLQYLPTPGLKADLNFGKDAAYSADGHSLALFAVGTDDFHEIIDAAFMVFDTAHLDQPVFVRHEAAYAVELSPDGRLLYVATREPALAVIDVRTGRTVRSIALSSQIGVAAPPDDLDSSLEIWDALADGMKVSPDGKTIAVADVNDVVLYDAATLTRRTILTGHSELVRSLQFSHTGDVLAAGADDHTAIVWDLATGGEVNTLTGHAGAVTAVAFSKDDGTLYTGGLDKHLMVWDLTGRRQFAARVVDGEHRTRVAEIAMPSPDGKAVVYTGATATGEHTRFLDVAGRRMGPEVPDPGNAPLAAWLPPDDQRVITAAGTVLKAWDRVTETVVDKRIISNADVTALAASPDGRYVFVGDTTGAMRRVDTTTLSSGPAIELGHPVVTVAAHSNDSAVAVLNDNSYNVVDFAGGEVATRGDVGFRASAAQVSPDGERLAVGGATGEVGLLDLGSQEWLSPPRSKVHRSFVGAVSFAPDGRTFVTSSFDGAVAFSNGMDGTLIAAVQVGQDESPAIATMTPDGHTAVVATTDGAVYRIDSQFQQWISHLCAVVGRDLTVEEWQTNFGGQAYRQTCSAD